MVASDVNVAALRRRFDRYALGQLREEVGRLAAENEALRLRVSEAELHADLAADDSQFWRDQAMDLQLRICESEEGSAPGLTQDGRLVIVR